MVWSQYLVIWYGDLPEENGQSSTVDLAGTREAPYRRVVSVTTLKSHGCSPINQIATF